MYKWIGILIILLASSVFLFSEKENKKDLNDLVRVDVKFIKEDGAAEERIIADEKSVSMLKVIFKEIEWGPIQETDGKKQDAVATLFFRYDDNLPERLVEYYIWFDHDGNKAMLIDQEEKQMGILTEEDADRLRETLFY